MAADMPVYEYACKSCGHHLEVSQSFKDPPLTECPVCAGPLRKVFNSIGIVLKGSGFYRTDSRTPAKSGSRDKGEKGGEASEAKSEAKADSKSESKSESKSDGKPESKASDKSSSDKGSAAKSA